MESNRNKGDKRADRKDCEEGRRIFKFTSKFLIGILEENDTVSKGKRPEELDLWLGRLTSLMYLKDYFQDLMCTQRTGGYYLLTEEDSLVQCSHHDFQSSKNNPPGYVLITMRQRDLHCTSVRDDTCMFSFWKRIGIA